MGASPIGAIRIRVEVFRPENSIPGKRSKDQRTPPVHLPARGFSFSSRPGRFVEARALGASVWLARPEQRQLVLKFTGTSFNGRTAVLQAANVGSIPTVSTNLRGELSGRALACQAGGRRIVPGSPLHFGRRLWRAGAPYKRARPGGLPGTGGIVTHGGYQISLMREDPGSSRPHKPAWPRTRPGPAIN